MRTRFKFKSLVFLLLILISFGAFSQNKKVPEKPKPPKPLTRILFVFDASASMYGRWQSDMKINIAQKLLVNLLDSLQNIQNLELALRIYGHQKAYPPQDCNDTKLEVPFAKGNVEVIKSKLRSVKPRGTTPIAASLEQAASDFPVCANCRNIIILITDGIEECSGDPCAVSKSLQEKGIVLKPFVIGIGKDFRAAFECLGTYYDASSEQQFRGALNVVISQALNSTTAQVNLLDEARNATETNVNMTFYDHTSGQVKYNYIHTMNARGLPDTLTLDPINTYDIVVHTIPPVRKDSIKLQTGKHTTIAIDAPQGSLILNIGGKNNVIKNYQCIVRKSGKMETLNIQNFNISERYLIGKYDLEILCLPRLYLYDVQISQSHQTKIEIPQPGIANISFPQAGNGSLYLEEDNKLKWLYNFREAAVQETISLLPGKYRIVFRIKGVTEAESTMEKSFQINSGQNIQVKF